MLPFSNLNKTSNCVKLRVDSNFPLSNKQQKKVQNWQRLHCYELLLPECYVNSFFCTYYKCTFTYQIDSFSKYKYSTTVIKEKYLPSNFRGGYF